MDVREILFDTFPRFFGNPKSFMIYNREELNRNASINSAENDKNFCSICSYYENVPIFSDLFFETDEIIPEPVRKVVLWFEARNIPWICLFSGSRGFHLHGLFDSTMVNQKTVKKFSNIVMSETETTDMFDPHVSGVLEKLCRIPNTQRLGNGWCVPITRKELFEINNPLEFKKLCVAPRFIDFKIGLRPSIFEFIKEDDTIEKPVQTINVAPYKEVFKIKYLLRPCVYDAIITPNPRHNFRISAVVELLNHGLTNSQIFSIFERLQWIDFGNEKTHYQIDYIEEKRKSGEFVVPYGKFKLGCTKKGQCIKCILNNQ